MKPNQYLKPATKLDNGTTIIHPITLTFNGKSIRVFKDYGNIVSFFADDVLKAFKLKPTQAPKPKVIGDHVLQRGDVQYISYYRLANIISLYGMLCEDEKMNAKRGCLMSSICDFISVLMATSSHSLEQADIQRRMNTIWQL